MEAPDAGLGRPALHGTSLSFPHPVGGDTVVVEAPLPNDWEIWMRRFQSGSFPGQA